MIARGIIGIAALGLTACNAPSAEVAKVDATPNVYLGVETALLDNDLVNFKVRMRGADFEDELFDYAECAAAQYTLIRGFGFTRHVRTTYAREGGVQLADAVYLISAGLPAGTRTIDAEVTVGACGVAGIPTV